MKQIYALKRLMLLAIIFICGCTAPHYIWPQKDMGVYEINLATAEKRVLIASRDSDFKRALVDVITKAYENQPVFVKIIGIEALENEDANVYSAVLLINTCMGWTVDVEVGRFLENYGTFESIIVLTTSAGGDVSPENENWAVDAISSASTLDRVQPLADELIGKIDRLIQ